MKQQLESINNPLYENERVLFSAVTNGCTKSADFMVEHEVIDGRCELTVVRIKPDYCRKASSIMEIELEWSLPSACADAEVYFLNPEIGDLASAKSPVRTLERSRGKNVPSE